MGGRLEPQPFCFASLDDTQPDGPNFKPFCSIQSVMTIWAAHSRSCKSKAVQLWQKLALDLQRKVEICKNHQSALRKESKDPMMLYGDLLFNFFFQGHEWTLVEMEQDTVRRWSRTQLGFFFPLHVQPMNELFILWKPTVLSEEMPLLIKLLFIAFTTQLQK